MTSSKFVRWKQGSGLRNHPLFKRYHAMRARCKNNGTVTTKFWGDKGIKVCERWMRFENFLEDMESSHKKHVKKYGKVQTTLERLDNKKDYSPENCVWSTRHEQNSNTSKNVFIEFKGERMTISEWSRELNIDRSTILYRVFKARWPLEKALTKRVPATDGRCKKTK